MSGFPNGKEIYFTVLPAKLVSFLFYPYTIDTVDEVPPLK